MQINIYRHKVLRCFKSHYFRRISQLEKVLASVLFPEGIPINFRQILKSSSLPLGARISSLPTNRSTPKPACVGGYKNSRGESSYKSLS